MNGIRLPRFLEEDNIPEGYFESPNPYQSAPSCNVDIGALARYARQQHKSVIDLTKEEVKKFAI